jgi:hypothetical protein
MALVVVDPREWAEYQSKPIFNGKRARKRDSFVAVVHEEVGSDDTGDCLVVFQQPPDSVCNSHVGRWWLGFADSGQDYGEYFIQSAPNRWCVELGAGPGHIQIGTGFAELIVDFLGHRIL